MESHRTLVCSKLDRFIQFCARSGSLKAGYSTHASYCKASFPPHVILLHSRLDRKKVCEEMKLEGGDNCARNTDLIIVP